MKKKSPVKKLLGSREFLLFVILPYYCDVMP